MDPLLYELMKRMIAGKEDYLSGEEMGKLSGVSRAAVWKHVTRLRESGFEFESVSRKGYRLTGVPANQIIPEMVSAFYGEKPPLQIYYVPQLDSTNSFAKRKVVEGFISNFVVISDDQTSGRGRLNREWKSQPGKDLSFTLNLKADGEISEFYQFTMITSVGIRKALEKYSTDIKIKWPNDIYVGENKLSGILTEMITEQNRIQNMIIGVGLNVNSRPVKFEGKYSSVSVSEIAGKPIERNELFADILRSVVETYDIYLDGLFENIYEDWKSNLAFIGKNVTVNNGKQIVSGILKDANRDGSAVIEVDGEEKIIYSGDLLSI